jgi:hypothetical protein
MSQSPNYKDIIKKLENKIKSEKNKHHKKITKLVKEYTQKYKKSKQKSGKLSPQLVNVNEEINLKGTHPAKRRPISEKRSRVLREIFKNEYPNEYHAYRPGARYRRHLTYKNSAYPNPYLK